MTGGTSPLARRLACEIDEIQAQQTTAQYERMATGADAWEATGSFIMHEDRVLPVNS